ncbi:hypothetical protein VL10_ORF05 [Staphylococcus phage vB_SauM_VL10]|nr:hypothetical protein VL10_ORF05 [Staphylococcus phage vB_SauM_VL10]
MDIKVSEINDYVLSHYTFVDDDTYACDLGKGYRIVLDNGMFNVSLKFIKNNRVVKEVINGAVILPKGFSTIYDLIDYYEEVLEKKSRKERERLKEIRTFFGK